MTQGEEEEEEEEEEGAFTLRVDWIHQLVQPPHHGVAAGAAALALHLHLVEHLLLLPRLRALLGVAAYKLLNLKKQTLKPGFHFIGSRVETRRLSSYGST
jgi:hypothetical protein